MKYNYEWKNSHHLTLSITKLWFVYTHLSAAIFIDFKAISSPDKVVFSIRALAEHSANYPPLPIPIKSSISKTFPVPSN